MGSLLQEISHIIKRSNIFSVSFFTGSETISRTMARTKSTNWEEERERMINLSTDDRRKEYFCDDFITLEKIQTWNEEVGNMKATKSDSELDDDKEILKIKEELLNNFESKDLKDIDLAEKISVYEGDITRLEIDSIVNAANNSLMGGGGVDGAIHRAAGPNLLKENREHGGCKDGEAVISGGYRLPAKYIISTVGPRGEKPEILHNAYTNCLLKMKENKLRSIAFPCISTGVYGYPNDAACNVALRATKAFLQEYHEDVDRVIFCLFLPVDVELYRQRLPLMFPIKE